jgi:hypothetical protein
MLIISIALIIFANKIDNVLGNNNQKVHLKYNLKTNSFEYHNGAVDRNANPDNRLGSKQILKIKQTYIRNLELTLIIHHQILLQLILTYLANQLTQKVKGKDKSSSISYKDKLKKS